MNHLVIIGAGAFGREIYWHIQESRGYGTEFDVKGYIADGYEGSSKENEGLQKPILSTVDDYVIEENDVFICAIGSTLGRKSTVERILAKGGEFISIINKTAIIQGNVNIGKGVFIGPYTVIGDNATLKDHTMVNTHSAVGHDAVLEKYVCVMSYVDITGYCRIGERVFLASGCRMTPSTNIGEGAYVGIGRVVLRKVKPGVEVFGHPAKVVDI